MAPMGRELEPVTVATPARLADVEVRLIELDRAAAEYVREQRPENTKRAYAIDWRDWCAYTRELGIPETTATPGALVGFVRWLELKGYAPTTMDRRLAGVAVELRQRGAVVNERVTKSARDALKAYKRRLDEAGETRGRGRAAAVTVRDLRRICAALPDTLAGTRDRAMLLIGFTIAARRSELASLRVDDIAPDEQGLVVTIRFGKTGGRTVVVPYGSHERTCPVRAWRAWLEASGITSGPAWRRIDRHGRMFAGGMSAEAVGEAITRAGARVGLAITGHSLRAGLVTEARRAGHDVKTICNQTGHSPKSGTVYDYIRIVDQWADNAVAGIGL